MFDKPFLNLLIALLANFIPLTSSSDINVVLRVILLVVDMSVHPPVYV
jgi:hypothetical protein